MRPGRFSQIATWGAEGPSTHPGSTAASFMVLSRKCSRKRRMDADVSGLFIADRDLSKQLRPANARHVYQIWMLDWTLRDRACCNRPTFENRRMLCRPKPGPLQGSGWGACCERPLRRSVMWHEAHQLCLAAYLFAGKIACNPRFVLVFLKKKRSSISRPWALRSMPASAGGLVKQQQRTSILLSAVSHACIASIWISSKLSGDWRTPP